MLRILLALARSLWISLASPAHAILYVAALEQQLAVYKAARIKPRLSVWDRLFWVLLSRWFHGWTRALVVVRPATVIDWHRKSFRMLWSWRSRPGRPPLDKKLVALILRIARDNPSWGAARIQGELLKLGFSVSVELVRKYVSPTSGPRAPRLLLSQPWRTFLHNHGRAIVACDFVTQHLAGFQTAYVFVVLHIESRKILWTNVTRNPSLDWVKLQLREVFAFERPFRFLTHDNDGIFGQFGAGASASASVVTSISGSPPSASPPPITPPTPTPSSSASTDLSVAKRSITSSSSVKITSDASSATTSTTTITPGPLKARARSLSRALDRYRRSLLTRQTTSSFCPSWAVSTTTTDALLEGDSQTGNSAWLRRAALALGRGSRSHAHGCSFGSI